MSFPPSSSSTIAQAAVSISPRLFIASASSFLSLPSRFFTFGLCLLKDDGELRREGRDELGHLAAGSCGLCRRRRSGGRLGAGRRRHRCRSRILYYPWRGFSLG